MKDKFGLDLIVNILKKAASYKEQPVPLHAPVFAGNEWSYVKECLDTGWVSSVGKYVDQFERMLEEFTGVGHAVAVVNGTAALHICLKLAGVEPNDEVIVPDLTFVASANAVSYCGAIPHFVDIEQRTLGLDPNKLEQYLLDISVIRQGACYNKYTDRRIKAVVPMHTFGHPVDIDRLVDVCEKYRLELVEDAAESLGSYYKGKHTGSFGKISALSFNGNKIVTTGGGGAILTNDRELAKLAKHITTTAKLNHSWEYVHDQIGYNYRMPNINAALGCAQLECLPDFLRKKRKLANVYKVEFDQIAGVKFFSEPEFATSNYWLNVLLLDDAYKDQRDDLLQKTNHQGIMTRPAWQLMHKLEMYKKCPVMDVTVSENIASRLINIPSSADMLYEKSD